MFISISLVCYAVCSRLRGNFYYTVWVCTCCARTLGVHQWWGPLREAHKPLSVLFLLAIGLGEADIAFPHASLEPLAVSTLYNP